MFMYTCFSSKLISCITQNDVAVKVSTKNISHTLNTINKYSQKKYLYIEKTLKTNEMNLLIRKTVQSNQIFTGLNS